MSRGQHLMPDDANCAVIGLTDNANTRTRTHGEESADGVKLIRIDNK